MNTIRNKLKHGFGHNKSKSVHHIRQTTAQQSVSTAASGSKPEKSLVDDSRISSRRTRKTTVKTAKNSLDPSATCSSSHSKSSEGSIMDRKKKSTMKPRKAKSFKATKPCPTPTTKELLNTENTASTNLRRSSRVCDSTHEGRLVLHSKLEIPSDQVFKFIFSQSEFFKEFQAKRNTTELQMGEWKTNKDGQRVRLITMTLALQGNIGPKTSKMIEEQSLRRCSQSGELYSIDVKCTHEGIPYADVFNVLLHYCIIDNHNNTTEMMVFANVNFTKTTWAVIKTFIMKHSLEGLSIYFSDLEQALKTEIAKSKRTSKHVT